MSTAYVRRVASADRSEFVALMQRSRGFHDPWITPPTTATLFRQYLARTARTDHEGFLVCDMTTDAIVGVVNINNIVRGSFLSASLGYYVGACYAGQGFMTQGLTRVLRIAFDELHLHRLEANIQPDNEPSKRLVMRCGFTYEGLSPAFLYINGAWRDHERWVAIDPRDSLRRGR